MGFGGAPGTVVVAGEGQYFAHLTFSPDGNTLAAVSLDGIAHLWRAPSWAEINGCQNPVFDAAPSLDVTTQVAGIDTSVMRYTQCPPGGSVELWTVNNGDHLLFWNQLTPQFLPLLVDWLLAHPKP
jgi:poly(3-hydroxybutyrate) depolymerase